MSDQNTLLTYYSWPCLYAPAYVSTSDSGKTNFDALPPSTLGTSGPGLQLMAFPSAMSNRNSILLESPGKSSQETITISMLTSTSEVRVHCR